MRKPARTIVTIIVFACVLLLAYAMLRDGSGPAEGEDWLDAVRRDAERRGAAQEDGSLLPPMGSDPSNAPRIAVETQDIDAGVIARDEITTFELVVYNEGQRELRINDVMTECGCTVGDIQSNRVSPGGQTSMTVAVNPYLMHDFQSDYELTILTNDPRNLRFPVRVRARVDPEFSMEPREIDFGEIPAGGAVEETIRIRQLTDTPVEITGAAPLGNPEALRLAVEQVPEDEWEQEGYAEYDVRVTYAPRGETGPVAQYFYVETNLERLPQLRGAVRGETVSFYAVSERRFRLSDSFAPGTDVIATADITSDEPLSIEGIEVTGSDYHAEVREGDDPGTAHIDIGVRPDAQAGRRAAEVRFNVVSNGRSVEDSLQVIAVIGDS